jgi:hypothetical protein
MNKDEQDNLLLRAADVFLWCFLLSYALLIFWLVIYLLAGDWIYGVNARWFEVSMHDFTLVNYWGMAFIKLCAIVFFLVPYLSIRIVLRKKRINA